MSLPRSFFTHLTLLAGDTFGVNTHQGAFLSRSSLWWNRCTGEQLCKVLNTYSNKNNKICWGSCVYARDCPGGCELDDDKSDLLSSAGSLCPIGAGQCAEIGEQEPEQEQIRTCTGDTLCKTTITIGPKSGKSSYSKERDCGFFFPALGIEQECVDAHICQWPEPVCLMDQKVLFERGNLPRGLCPVPGFCGGVTRAVLKTEEKDEEVPGEDGGSVFDSDPETKEGVTSTTEDMFQKAVEENEKENKANAAFMRLLRSMDKAEIKEFLVKEIGLGRDDVNRYLKNNVLRKLSRISSFGRREVQDLYKSLASN